MLPSLLQINSGAGSDAITKCQCPLTLPPLSLLPFTDALAAVAATAATAVAAITAAAATAFVAIAAVIIAAAIAAAMQMKSGAGTDAITKCQCPHGFRTWRAETRRSPTNAARPGVPLTAAGNGSVPLLLVLS